MGWWLSSKICFGLLIVHTIVILFPFTTCLWHMLTILLVKRKTYILKVAWIAAAPETFVLAYLSCWPM